MDEKLASTMLPRGYFPILITVGAGLAERFIKEARLSHSIVVVQPPRPADSSHEQTVVAVPFPDKERLRVDFNVFASEMEREHGVRTEFLMESATEFMP